MTPGVFIPIIDSHGTDWIIITIATYRDCFQSIYGISATCYYVVVIAGLITTVLNCRSASIKAFLALSQLYQWPHGKTYIGSRAVRFLFSLSDCKYGIYT